VRRAEIFAAAVAVAAHVPLALATSSPEPAPRSISSAAPRPIALVEPPRVSSPTPTGRTSPRRSTSRASSPTPSPRSATTPPASSHSGLPGLGVRIEEVGTGGHGVEIPTGDLRSGAGASRGAARPDPERPLDEREADRPPTRVGGDEPVYPALEALGGREGSVVLRIIVRADGSVAEAEVVAVRGASAFGSAAREAVLGWRFEPARKDGRAVDCVCTQRLSFLLGKSR
jgi:protein TonB